MQVDDLYLYLKYLSSTDVFKHFASKNQLRGLSVSGTLVKNGLNEVYKIKYLKGILRAAYQ